MTRLLLWRKYASSSSYAPSGVQAHDLAHGIHEGGPAVRREAHDLVLVAVMRKTEILRESLVKNAERMREKYSAVDGDALPLPTPQAELEKSPKPSIETTTASSKGETWNADDRCAK